MATDQIQLTHDPCLAGGGEMGALMRSLDWSPSALGPVQAWPQSLRTAVSICLNSRFPILIWWGPALIMLYNDAYRPILGTKKHPQALGQRGQAIWPEIWPIIWPMLEGVLIHGEATWSNDQLLVLDRHGYLEECYFTFSYSPIRDESGQVSGVFTAVTETTAQVVSERRLRTLRDLAARAVTAQSAETACTLAVQALADNRADLPFVLLYRLDDQAQKLHLAGATGLDAGQLASPIVVDVKDGATEGHTWPFAQVLEEGREEQVTDLRTRFGALPGGPWLDAPTTALLLPLSSSAQGRPTGILVAGISPRRTLDAEYSSFLALVAGQVATAIADARAYEAERARAEALAELDRAKTTFFSNISHEFRTPLTLMLGPLNDLLQQKPPLPPRERVQLEMVYGNGLRLLKLVNTLLDFSQLQEGRMQAHYEPTDLAGYTVELASVFRSITERAGLQLQVDCPPLPEPIYVDRAMWEKIVLNLLSNAFKFTLTGAIMVALDWHGDGVSLTVRDTGIGIPAAELPHIFSRFHRVRGAMARTQEGSGIGLALVQGLSKLHGGTVQVESREGEGSTFTVTIPTGAAHLPADRIHTATLPSRTLLEVLPYVEEIQRWLPASGLQRSLPDNPSIADREEDSALTAEAARSEAPLGHHPLQNPNASTILLADDNADMRAYLTRLLSQRYTVDAVADGAAALTAMRLHKPDLVLADVMMPKLDGFALLQAIRNDPQLCEVPVILLSARAGEESRVEGLKAGADDYLIKPFSARELLARVEAHLALQRLREAASTALRQSEERFRIVSELTSDYAYALRVMVDGTVKKEWVFGAFEEITGYPVTEFDDFTLWQTLLHPDDLSIAVRHVDRLQAGKADTSEFRILTKTGETRWLQDYAQPQIDQTGRVFQIIGATRDITAHKQAEEALRESEARFRHMADNAPTMIWVTDPAGSCIFLNRPWYLFTGQTETDSHGLGWLAAVHPADRPKTETLFLSANANRASFKIEYRLRRHDGAYRWAIDTAVPRFSEKGDFLGYIGSVTDIHERKQAEEAVQRSESQLRSLTETLEQRVTERTAELERSNRELDQFAYIASHDLKTPLRGIHNLAQWIAEDAGSVLPKPSTEHLLKLQGRVQRMERLLDDLLAYSRVGRRDERAEMVQTKSLLEEVVSLLAPPDGFTIRMEGELPTLMTPHAPLELVFRNLISNAIKHHRQPYQGEVRISAQELGDYVEFCVIDNGPGIAPQHHERIFDMFQVLRPRDEVEGSGMGLAIVKKTVEHRKGKIRVTSTAGKGTCFCFTWPKGP